MKAVLDRRVRKAAEELGYAPNLLARGLRASQTQTIGVISGRAASTPFAGRMPAGAQTAAWKTSQLLLVDTGGNAEMAVAPAPAGHAGSVCSAGSATTGPATRC